MHSPRHFYDERVICGCLKGKAVLGRSPRWDGQPRQ